MRFAAIETSTEWCSVAVWSDGEIAALERRAGNRHSELALPMLEKLLRKNQLDAVAFGAGPGAFTGLRIACGLAQGLAFGRGLPVMGISTFEALAQEAGATRVVACIDARMREVYYAALEKRAGRWHEVVAAQCVAPQSAPKPPGDGWVGVGSGFEAYRQELASKVSMVRSMVHPTALSVAQLAAPRFAAGEGVDAAQAAPVYLRDKVALTQQELGRR
ncbi:MAG TPA: tRNA (adenosine(37)-N6)-threonylcarbamoyltransferase complex dimerization subunit type 1 TsaB [Burkholderiales bacterium]|nr:tRNA (adenosine(37)-N6)-threonylcarbamoyltransferase complex dimerization subunit type 1 TsaB [Burkholderiales bacterium]